ncbi:MAG: RHS repeat-associated core domain-containing protein, partial [Spirochaetota bacterium]
MRLRPLAPRGDRRLAAGVPLDRAACALQRFDRLGRRWRLDSVDAGTKLALLDAADSLARERTANGVLLTTRHDALRRPVEVRADGVAIRRFVYGESHPAAEARNLRGRVFRVYDGAGVLSHERYDHHGNLEARTRRVPSAHESAGDLHQPLVYDALPRVAPDGSDPLADDTIDPSIEPALEPALREETAYDALSRPVTETLHDGSVVRPRYNEAGVLEAIDLAMDGGSHNVIANIDYDARGQRTRVEYAAGAFVTTYRYDPLSFRLVTLRTVRASDGAALQHLAYTYDAVGNITSSLDHAIQDRIPGHDLAVPHRFFDYDGLGQLIEATGRAIPRYSPDAGDDPRDPGGLRRYTERYSYDASGNLRERAFRVAAAPGLRRGFTQRFEVEAGQVPSRPDVHGNRLVASERTSHPASGSDDTIRVDYRSDGAGNLLTLGLGTELAWSPEHSLGSYSRTAVDAAYAYDAEGERVRKVVSTGAGTRRERVYFKYFERYRERRPDGGGLERTTLHVTGSDRRVLLIERDEGTAPRLRFQLGDHLDTVALEVDESGAEITYEEHLPYGETAFSLAFRDVPRKRYRYTGKERDEESGLQYHSARYLAPWLARWCSADPAEFVDGPNLFGYVAGSPTTRRDPSGRELVFADHRVERRWHTQPDGTRRHEHVVVGRTTHTRRNDTLDRQAQREAIFGALRTGLRRLYDAYMSRSGSSSHRSSLARERDIVLGALRIGTNASGQFRLELDDRRMELLDRLTSHRIGGMAIPEFAALRLTIEHSERASIGFEVGTNVLGET